MIREVRWCDLPKELLEMICHRLHSRLELLRFRCVCRSWRLPNLHLMKTDSFLSERTFRCIEPPPPPIIDANSPYFSSSPSFQGWMIKVVDVKPGRSRLLCPLSERRINYSSDTFPDDLNLIDFRVRELCKAYTLNPDLDCALFVKKVVPFPYERDLVIAIWRDGKLRYSYCQDYDWTEIGDHNFRYDDIAVHNEQLYVVDRKGAVSWINSSLNLIPYSPPIHSCFDTGSFGTQKNLVESCGELYVVVRYEEIKNVWLSPPHVDRAVSVFLENSEARGSDKFDRAKIKRERKLIWEADLREHISFKTVGLKVYKLDEDWGRWVEVKSLGDRLFILATDCCFSISAREFAGCQGNCIYFTNRKDDRYLDTGLNGHDVNVFKLDDGRIGKLASFPGYSQIFWPPPTWLRPKPCLPWC